MGRLLYASFGRFIALKMEAVHTFETSVYRTRLHGAIFQKAVIFIK
jgi:hypothetical protein